MIAAVVSDDEALAFLPPLPPFSSGGPNELKRNIARFKGITKEVGDLLMGARMDGERPRWVVEWGLECYVVKGGKGEGVVVHRVIGMQGS